MHLQQTKVESRISGGPQYYFHDVPRPIKEFLRGHGKCPVVLQTPYGIANSPFLAVGRDHKIEKDGRLVPGKVGHDRIQQGSGERSIGEAIRYWYNIEAGSDFESIKVEAAIHPDGHFILIPLAVKLRGRKRSRVLEKIIAPLSFHHDYWSKFWRNQLEAKKHQASSDVNWAASQLVRVVAEHDRSGAKNILESDLLRTAGALSVLGLELSPYLGKGYDCIDSCFSFTDFPKYQCPVEIKKRSQGFSYQVTRYTKLPRAVVLCMEHDLLNPPEHIDIIELRSLSEYLQK